jgi:multiple sugar transport system permease protein
MTSVAGPIDPPRSPVRPRRRRIHRSQRLAALVFMLPWLIGFVVIVLGPMLASFYLSFTRFRPGREPDWVGLGNYIRMFTNDPVFYESLKVTAVYVLFGVPLQLTVALALAYYLDKGIRGLSIYRAIFYLPSLMGGSVAIAILWRQAFGQDGLVNQALALIGIEGQSWIGNPDTALGTLILLLAWQFGSPMLIFLAGLRQIPSSLYEAASIDGAGPWRKFISITLPMLSPIILFNLILQLINSFQAFSSAYVVSGGTGGPSNSTLFFTLNLFNEGFRYLNMGYASALAWVLFTIVGALTAANFIASRYWVFYDD